MLVSRCSSALYWFLGPVLIPTRNQHGSLYQPMWDDSPPVLRRCVDPLSVGPRADTILYSLDVPSEKLLIASFDGESATYLSVTFGSPSLIIKCTMIRALNTIVHVESLKRFCRVRNISATPASPAWVATRICSTYLALGGASYFNNISKVFWSK